MFIPLCEVASYSLFESFKGKTNLATLQNCLES